MLKTERYQLSAMVVPAVAMTFRTSSRVKAQLPILLHVTYVEATPMSERLLVK